MLLYYITDRTQFPGSEPERRVHLLEKISEAARCGVDMIQLREKDLSTRELELLARDAMRLIRENASQHSANQAGKHLTTRLLINSRTDVAVAVGADGVHLRSDDLAASEARVVFSKAGVDHPIIIGVSCHTVAEVRLAEAHGADFAVFGPVFEKGEASATEAAGPATRKSSSRIASSSKGRLPELRQACGMVNRQRPVNPAGKMPVLALGGITLQNAQKCIAAGAAGIAAIRLFQGNDIERIVTQLQAG